jgi:regulator of protease activity HflC (stomatin/prohibitin superfamily)
MKKLFTIFLSFVLIACSRVDTGEVGIKTTYGKVTGSALSPGQYWYLPGISDIHILNTKIQTVEQDSQAASRDLQNVQTQLTLNYHLGTQDPIGHYVRLGDNQGQIEASIVKPAMSEAFKSAVAQFNAEELITKREQVSNLIVTTLSQRLKQYDLYVDSVSVTNFKFSDAYAAAIEAKQVAEQEANKAKNVLQKAQIEAQQKVVEAKAQADSMALQRQVVTPELIQLKQLEIQQKIAEKWDGAYPTTYVGNPNALPLLQVGK